MLIEASSFFIIIFGTLPEAISFEQNTLLWWEQSVVPFVAGIASLDSRPFPSRNRSLLLTSMIGSLRRTRGKEWSSLAHEPTGYHLLQYSFRLLGFEETRINIVLKNSKGF